MSTQKNTKPRGGIRGPFLRAEDLPALVGLSVPTVYRQIRRGEFPAPARLSPGRVGWLPKDIDAWLADRGLDRDPTRFAA